MRHRIAIYCPESRRSEDGFYRYSYSDRLHLETHYPSAVVFGSIQDAAELQRLNPQHEIKIYYASNRAEVPLWFMRKYAHYEEKPSQLAQAWHHESQISNNMYEPSHPIVDQAPAFIYRPSQKFLNKKKDIVVSRLTGYKAVDHSTLTMTALKEYLTDIFITRNRNGKEKRNIKIGIYCPHVGQHITIGPDSWGCSECYYERVGKHLHEEAQNYLKADKYYGKTNKA